VAVTARYWLVEDVAELLGCSPDTVYRMTAAGTIPHRRIGGTRRLLFIEDELRRWVDGAELEIVRAPNGGRIVRPVTNGGAA
jgi:excisionase family DNA binding protein